LLHKTDSPYRGFGELDGLECDLGEFMKQTTWRELIQICADGDVIIACTLSEHELDTKFYAGLGEK
jgi:hypothetical protein